MNHFFFSSVYLLSALMPPTRRRPAILALHATRRPSRQTSSRLEASPLFSTFVAFSIRSPPFLELRRSRSRAAHRRALRRPPLTVLPPICCALGRLASPRTCSTPSRAGPSPCSCARGAAARHQRRRAPASVETPSPAAPNLVRTHQWVALDVLVLIHPSITAGEHPHRRNRRSLSRSLLCMRPRTSCSN